MHGNEFVFIVLSPLLGLEIRAVNGIMRASYYRSDLLYLSVRLYINAKKVRVK